MSPIPCPPFCLLGKEINFDVGENVTSDFWGFFVLSSCTKIKWLERAFLHTIHKVDASLSWFHRLNFLSIWPAVNFFFFFSIWRLDYYSRHKFHAFNLVIKYRNLDTLDWVLDEFVLRIDDINKHDSQSPMLSRVQTSSGCNCTSHCVIFFFWTYFLESIGYYCKWKWWKIKFNVEQFYLIYFVPNK